jgi:hypothetical protein
MYNHRKLVSNKAIEKVEMTKIGIEHTKATRNDVLLA